MKSISRFEAAEPLSAHNILCGTLPPPDRRDEHPFVPLITYLDVRCPEQPHGWNATADVFFDDILAGLLGSACGIREALQRGTMDLAAARIAVETLRKRCIAHGERLGGDEFAVLMPCEHAAGAGRLAERILEALRSGKADGACGPQIATSIGIALYPDDADDQAALLSYADTALYRAKSEGRGTYRFFEAKMGLEVRERRLLEHDLRHAVARGEMHLVYQPQTEVGSGEVIGFEVLLRWKHPERGYVSPAVFIPIAEESDAILQIGEWVLREACREAATWPNPLSLAINVSAVQIHGPHFVGLVHEVLLQTGLAPDRLEVEVTETSLIRDPHRALLTLRQLKALGLRIAMDDFGTGYSSLSNLRSFPFDKIKIDASFVRSVDTNAQTAAIVRSVIRLGRGLGLPVLAEGVETEAELGFLAAEACHAAQGYLMGRPSPIGEFARFTHGQTRVFEQMRQHA